MGRIVLFLRAWRRRLDRLTHWWWPFLPEEGQEDRETAWTPTVFITEPRREHVPIGSVTCRCGDPLCRVMPAVPPGREQTHTRTSTDCGPDFCDECSRAAQEWVRWPCPAATSAATGSERQPYTASLRDRLAVPVIQAAFRLASPSYRGRIHRLIVGGMRHGH